MTAKSQSNWDDYLVDSLVIVDCYITVTNWCGLRDFGFKFLDVVQAFKIQMALQELTLVYLDPYILLENSQNICRQTQLLWIIFIFECDFKLWPLSYIILA